jgi:ribosome-binding protein aMBF1 (putative translation factor)
MAAAMIDVACPHCGKKYGFAGRVIDCPPCPRCGKEPDRAGLEHDQAILDEFAEFAREWKERGRLVKPGRQRMAAGLTRRQAAKILGVDVLLLADVEAGRAEPGAELAAKMAAAYGFAGG